MNKTLQFAYVGFVVRGFAFGIIPARLSLRGLGRVKMFGCFSEFTDRVSSLRSVSEGFSFLDLEKMTAPKLFKMAPSVVKGTNNKLKVKL